MRHKFGRSDAASLRWKTEFDSQWLHATISDWRSANGADLWFYFGDIVLIIVPAFVHTQLSPAILWRAARYNIVKLKLGAFISGRRFTGYKVRAFRGATNASEISYFHSA
jgi:hypothetical protein